MWPVIRLNNVDFPVPFGPITAAIWPVSTVRLTPPTATKPAKDLRSLRTSSIAGADTAAEQAETGDDAADDAAREEKEEDQQQAAEHKWPIFGVSGDLLVEPDERQGTHRRSPEIVHAAKDRHDDDLGRFRPEDVVGKDTAAENAVERAGKSGKNPRNDEGCQLVGAHVDADKGGALRIIADRCQYAAKRRAHNLPQHR